MDCNVRFRLVLEKADGESLIETISHPLQHLFIPIDPTDVGNSKRLTGCVLLPIIQRSVDGTWISDLTTIHVDNESLLKMRFG